MNDFIEFQMPGMQRRPYVTGQRTRAWLCAIVCLPAACSRAPASTAGYDRAAQPPALESKLFTRMPAAYTGVRFENQFRESVDTNVFIYRNYYNDTLHPGIDFSVGIRFWFN